MKSYVHDYKLNDGHSLTYRQMGWLSHGEVLSTRRRSSYRKRAGWGFTKACLLTCCERFPTVQLRCWREYLRSPCWIISWLKGSDRSYELLMRQLSYYRPWSSLCMWSYTLIKHSYTYLAWLHFSHFIGALRYGAEIMAGVCCCQLYILPMHLPNHVLHVPMLCSIRSYLSIGHSVHCSI